MSLYPIFELAMVVLIAAVSLYQAIKVLMPRAVGSARARVALRLSSGAGAAGWRHALAVKVGKEAPQSACDTGCSSGCNGCSVAVQARN
jgi:hypothetical protein